ncbi:hypothetical protein GALL_369400 [mine drainage metagenome]|uniref:Uncharacterized protein n=1 Tax=mine drainage metagenome TaxID=410659 RepID=A0A1J5QZG3_9ZZZZ
MMRPLPPQVPQVCCIANGPMRWVVAPLPWQLGQVFGLVPGLAPLP